MPEDNDFGIPIEDPCLIPLPDPDPFYDDTLDVPYVEETGDDWIWNENNG